jgi:aspartyl-tRNA(Asn)/glutamyl-tRNA(Gln) amidotransferase subunit A
MMNAFELTIAEAGKLIRERKLTSIELTEACLEQIERLEPKLEAWVTIDAEGARAAAKKADDDINRGIFHSPLHGVPVGVKDIYFTKGLRTTMGSPFYRDHVPDRDADIVAKLKECGAVILGKTETTEFAFLDPAPTRNPWALDHTPGGSSSGSAAAVSARMTPLAFGSQTGGSVTRPASFCGVIGVKPTYDLLSRGGVYPLAWSLDHIGYMTRTIEDAALTLDALTGTKTQGYVPDHNLRIGYLEGYFTDFADRNVSVNYNEAIQRLWRGENLLDPFEMPQSFASVPSAFRVIMFAESATIHRDNFRTRMSEYRPQIRSQIASGLMIPTATYLQAQRIRGIFIRDMLNAMKGFDLIACPSAPTPALSGLESTGDAAFNSPWSFAGFPTVTVPSGLSMTGLPLGIQLIARPYEEALLLAAGRWAERKLAGIGSPQILR